MSDIAEQDKVELMRRIGVLIEQRVTVDPDGTQHLQYTPDMLYDAMDDMDLCFICGERCIVHSRAQRRAAYVDSVPYMIADEAPLFLKRTPGNARCDKCGAQLRRETTTLCAKCR